MGTDYTINGDWLIHHPSRYRIRLSAISCWSTHEKGLGISVFISGQNYTIFLSFTSEESFLACVQDLDALNREGTT